jgi:hypothetical protein
VVLITINIKTTGGTMDAITLEMPTEKVFDFIKTWYEYSHCQDNIVSITLKFNP